MRASRVNGHGRYGEALAYAREACEREEVIAFGRGLIELIEAGVPAVGLTRPPSHSSG